MMENNGQERIIINNIRTINRHGNGTQNDSLRVFRLKQMHSATQNLIGCMLNAARHGRNFAYILNSPELKDHRFEFIEAILSPKPILGNKSVLQTYLESDNIQQADKDIAESILMKTLFSGDPGLLKEYLDNNNIESRNKQQCLNVLVNNSTIIQEYFEYFNNYHHQGVFIGTLFEPREELGGQSYFDKIENKQLILEGILTDNNWSGLKKYLADPNINIDNKEQCVNELINRGVMENYLLNPHNDDNKKVELMETLFKPRVFLNNQSYFDRIENKQSILNSLLSGNNHSVLEQYLADHDIDRDDKNQCINRLVNDRAIENYLANPNNDDNKKVELIKTLFEPREELGDQSYFDRIEYQHQRSIGYAILSNNVVLEQYLANERISPRNKQQCLNELAGNIAEWGVMLNYLSHNNFNKKADLIETLFKPRNFFLNNQSCFDEIEDKPLIVMGILTDRRFQPFLEQYLTDNNIELQNRQQCLNGLSRYPETANWLARVDRDRSLGLIKILFEPRDFLDGESYFDRIENKQLMRRNFLGGEDRPLLERYLADNDINTDDKLQCLNVLNSYTETQDLLGRVRLEPELAVIQTLFARQNDGLNNQLPLDQYLNDVNIPVKNKARTLNSIFTIIGEINEGNVVRINMLNNLKNTLTRQSFVTNFNRGNHQRQRLAIGNAGNEEQAENVALPENVENEEHLQDRKTTFLHIMMDPRYDPKYDENLDITTSDINRKEVIQKIGQICPELLLDARDQLGNTVLNQTILLPYPNTIQREAGEALQQHEAAAEARLKAAETELARRKEVQEIEQVIAQDKLEGAQANLQAAQRNLQEAQANLQAAQDDLQLAQKNLELKEGENQQACQKLLHYDDYIKFQLMHLLINANTDILYPRIQQRREGQQVVPPAEQQVRGNANQENNGNQENHEENRQVVQRREADSPLIMLLKNNNWLLFGKILYGMELQFQPGVVRLFSDIKDRTLNVALNEADIALNWAAGCGGYGGLNTCNFNYFLSRPFEYVNDFDNNLIEARKLNTKLVPGLKYHCEDALELKSDKNYMLYEELNFYSPRLGEARNLINPRGNKTLNNVNFEGHTFEDTINDYLSCYQAIENTYNIIHPNQIENGPAPVVGEHAEPEVALLAEPEVVPPAEQQVRGNVNQENNGNQEVALNDNDENALRVRGRNRNVILNQPERPRARRGDDENQAVNPIEALPAANPQARGRRRNDAANRRGCCNIM